MSILNFSIHPHSRIVKVPEGSRALGPRGSSPARLGRGDYGQLDHVTSLVRQAYDDDRSGRRRRSELPWAAGSGTGDRRPVRRRGGGRHQDSLLLPRLWQVRVRRVGLRQGRPRHPHRGRRDGLRDARQPLLQGPGVNPGVLSPRSHQVPHEAHESQGVG